MFDYSVSLAVFDYVPMLLSALGTWLICAFIGFQQASNRPVAIVGWGLIVSAGLAKTSWKLTVAVSGTNLAWLNNSFFMLLTPGFVLLSHALWSSAGANRGHWLQPATVLMAAALASAWLWHANPQARLWVLPLIALTTLANCVLIYLLARYALRLGARWAAGLFVTNLLISFLLAGLSRLPQHTAASQWLEQSLNSLAQLALAAAAWKLLQLAKTPHSTIASGDPQ